MNNFFAMKNLENHCEVTHAAKYLLPIRVLFMLCLRSQRGGVLQAVKQFDKEIGAPEKIVCDAVGE